MRLTPKFLSVEQVIRVHARGIAEHGGSAELRDRGLLESAVAMPMSQFGGEYMHDGIPAMAAAYLFHLCKNHPFVDGNKRVAVATAETFLLANGLKLRATDVELEKLTVGVADGSTSKADVATFLESHVTQ